MAVLQDLDAAALRGWVVRGREALQAVCEDLNVLNVYPVPDADTGTNLFLTLTAADDAVAALEPAATLQETAGTVARALLLGARGNSGGMLAQFVRGLLDVLVEPGEPHPGRRLARGLTRGAELAGACLAAPVAGTMLTVAQDAARAAQAVNGTLADTVTAARGAAELSLARTPDLLPVLRQAGVVDAGGQGLVVLLLALEEIVLQRRGCDGASGERPARARPVPVSGAQPSHEVQFLLHGADQAAVAVLRDRLGVLGDSVLIAGEAGLHHVHVHTDDVRAVVAAGSASGRPAAVRVTHLIDGTTTDPLIRDRIVVAVVSGEGLSALFARAGARVLHGGPLARPTQDELLEALLEPGVREVVLLPNDEGGLRTARAAAAEAATAGVCVAVVASTSAVQGLAALAVADPGRSWEDTVRDMSAAVDATRCAQVVLARGSAITAAGTCLPGDALGVVAGEVVLVGADVDWVARQMLDRLAPDAELVTVVLGAGAGADTGELLAAHAARRHPGVVVTVLSGGQPHCAVLLGAE